MLAYFIVDNEVTDPTGFEEYRNQVPATVERYGGRFLVRGSCARRAPAGYDDAREGGAATGGLGAAPDFREVASC